MKKEIIIFICLIIAIISALFVAESTFSKYKRKFNAKVEGDIARWDIKVNTESILNKTKLTNNIVPTFASTSHKADQVVAPGAAGYIDIVIDPTDCDVSFSWILHIDVSEESAVSDMIATGYKINPVNDSGPIAYNKTNGVGGNLTHNGASVLIRVYVRWNDDPSTQEMDNYDDTEVTFTSTNKAVMTASLEFIQSNS